MASRAACNQAALYAAEDLALAKDLPHSPFALLLRATQYACNSRRPVWEFALVLAELRRAGFTESDLRWLACKGYIEHAWETSRACCADRTFRPPATPRFSDCSSFVLTPRGAVLAENLLSHGFAGGHIAAASSAAAARTAPVTARTPCWDRQRRELRMGPIVIKRFCVPAGNQETVLTAFEEEAWPVHIDDPLPPLPEMDPKRRLHSTIQCLNRNQKMALVRFHGDGCGSGLWWELLTA